MKLFKFGKSNKEEIVENENSKVDKELVIENDVDFGNDTLEMYMSQIPDTLSLMTMN